MPDPSEKYSKQIRELISKEFTKKIDKQFTDVLTGGEGLEYPSTVIVPDSVEYDRLRKTEQRKFKDAIMQDWNEIRKTDPNEQFRKQVTKDIAEIKDAIRKIGIMFEEDKPNKKHKMLNEAYKKYKFTEALVLDDEE
jgi:hypothetical protein